MEEDDDGYFNLGNDGVLRSLSSTNKVLAYAQLSPRLISAFLARPPEEYWAQNGQHLRETFNNVDGRTVTNIQQLVDPGEDIVPPRRTLDTSSHSTILPGSSNEVHETKTNSQCKADPTLITQEDGSEANSDQRIARFDNDERSEHLPSIADSNEVEA